MKKIFNTIFLSAIAISAIAVPARRGAISRIAEDGTEKTVYLHGNAYYHYMTDAKGNWLDETTLKPLSEEVKAVRMRRGAERQQARRAREEKKVGSTLNLAPRGLIILVNFKDKSFKTPIDTIKNMIDGENFTRDYKYSYSYDGQTYTEHITCQGSARQYFHDQSWGQYNPIFDVAGPVTLSQNLSYYGKNDSYYNQDMNADKMIDEACKLADSQFDVDFTQYDNNNDGFVDFVYVIYAGYGEADGGPANTIWPHNSVLIYQGQGIKCIVDGKQVNNYACSNEIQYTGEVYNGIGTFCHEFSHVLGLPDLYITEETGTTHKTLGDWDILDYGPYNNDGNTPPSYSAYERFFCGWITPRILKEPENVTLHPLNESGEALLICSSDAHNLDGTSPNPTDFYLAENRVRQGWDSYLPGRGMLLTHIRYSNSKWTNNTVNNNSNTMGVDLVEADGKAPSYDYNNPNNGYSGKAKDAFPAGSKQWTELIDHEITNITLSNNLIKFLYIGGWPEGVEEVPGDPVQSTKVLRNGQLYILRNGQTYDLNGKIIE